MEDGVEDIPASGFFQRGHVVLEIVARSCPGPRRVACDVCEVKLTLLEGSDGFFESLDRLSWESHDNIGEDRKEGVPGAEILDLRTEIRIRVFSIHTMEYLVVSALECEKK